MVYSIPFVKTAFKKEEDYYSFLSLYYYQTNYNFKSNKVLTELEKKKNSEIYTKINVILPQYYH